MQGYHKVELKEELAELAAATAEVRRLAALQQTALGQRAELETRVSRLEASMDRVLAALGL